MANKNTYSGKQPGNLNVQRPIYQLEDLNRDHHYQQSLTTLGQKCKRTLKSINFLDFLFSIMPILKWLPHYKWKKSFLNDVISGITVAIMHIPQGMGYGLLGGVPPVVGIYMAFFPVLTYFLFGTSRHVSIGTFAIVCLMTGKIVYKYSTIEILQNGTLIKTHIADENPQLPLITNIEVATTVTFTVAFIQIIMYILRLGIISTLLSTTLVNGFTCAAAFHVVSSQLKDLLGLPTKKRTGNFSFVYTLYDAILAVPKANYYACIISLITCILLLMNNYLFKSWLSKRTRLPIPIELIAVVFGTTISYLLNLNENFSINTIGRIPTGLPPLTIPSFQLIPDIILDAFIITIVSYSVTISMALIFARKLSYEIDSNQELLALGLSNTVGSFFSSLPIAASLSRSMIQQAVGGVTQLASVVSCCILLVILLWIGPLFESLPRCVLASIIVVALGNMLLQCKLIVKYWKLSKWDASIWIVTFFTTLFVQISYGLAAGVILSLFSIFIQGYRPYTCLLGNIPNTDIYLDIKRYKGAFELNYIKIFHYSGGLNFASRNDFKLILNKKIGFHHPTNIFRKIRNYEDNSNNSQNTNSDNNINENFLLIKCIILDFSAITFIDPSGVELLRQLQMDYTNFNISFYIAACSSPVYEMFIKCDQLENVTSKFLIFPTIHDAVLYAQTNIVIDNNKSKNN